MRTTSRALAFASRWFDAATVERVFEPLVADWQREWQDASGFRRGLVHIRALTAFVCVTLISSHRILRQPTPSTVANRIVTRIARFTLVMTALSTLPYLSQQGALGLALLFLIPSGLVLAFPFAMIAAVDAIRRDHALSPQVERATAVKLAIAALLFMLTFHGFVVPAANQAYRTAGWSRTAAAFPGSDISMRGPRPGVRELNTYELLTDHGFADGTRFLPEQVNRELGTRASLALLPLVLLWLRWNMLERPGSHVARVPATAVAVAAFLVFGFFWQNTVLGPWPSLMIASLLLCLDSWRRARRAVLA